MTTYKTNNLEMNKRTPLEFMYLKSIGWKLSNPWTITGTRRVEVSAIGEYIQDKKFLDNIAKWHKMMVTYYNFR